MNTHTEHKHVTLAFIFTFVFIALSSIIVQSRAQLSTHNSFDEQLLIREEFKLEELTQLFEDDSQFITEFDVFLSQDTLLDEPQNVTPPFKTPESLVVKRTQAQTAIAHSAASYIAQNAAQETTDLHAAATEKPTLLKLITTELLRWIL